MVVLPRCANRAVIVLSLLFGLMALSGCVSVPQTLQGTTSTPLMQLAMVQNSPKLFIGAEARFGGTVVGMANEGGQTVLEIAVVELDSGARPMLGQPSQGRLLASVNGFLDPVDFRGRLVTVVGPITGMQAGQIDMMPYQFVTMQVNGLQRWQITQQIIMPPPPARPWHGPHPHHRHQGWYGGYGWHHGPIQIRTIVTE
ncbi:Slp family lipoprotein [Serratia microhaemolytica]|uniref:Slp family lipoprotein n=1 Tax=Serratia microhaemolytica TaxID=2675110 RepID=UPI000FDD824E|nr:Slp family lipoprotein [Serratia microhaemolytica]